MPNIIIVKNTYPDFGALERTLNYIQRSSIVGGYALDPSFAFQQMAKLKTVWHKEDGVQLLHFIIAFTHQEAFRISVDEVLELGFQIGILFSDYQLAYAVHMDSSRLHLHCILNTVSFVDGHKYSDGLAGFWRLKTMLQTQFPKSDIGIYRSFPNSKINTFSFSKEDYLLKID